MAFFDKLPGEGREAPCDVCGNPAESSCICPECPLCGEAGCPRCYAVEPASGHGMSRSEAQLAAMAAAKQRQADEAEYWAKYGADIEESQKER